MNRALELRADVRSPRVGGPALATIIGGGAVAVGACMPWMSFYAGLHTVNGLSGMNGKVLLVAGVILVAMGLTRLVRDSRVRRTASTLIGIVVTGGAGYLLWRAQIMVHTQEMMMLVPTVGAGLWLTVLGGGITAIAGLAPSERSRLADGEGPRG